jgi:hypothetical protein
VQAGRIHVELLALLLTRAPAATAERFTLSCQNRLQCLALGDNEIE